MNEEQREVAERLADAVMHPEAAALLRELAAEPQGEPLTGVRAWTLLLVGRENGLVGKHGETFPSSPEHYERVTVHEAHGIGETP